MLMKKKAEQTETHENMGSTAMDDVNRAIELNPQSCEHHYHRGLLKVKNGDLQGAIDDLSKSIELCTGSGESCLLYALKHLDRSIAKREVGDLIGSLEDVNRAIEINPKLAEAYSERAYIKTLMQGNSGELKN